MRTKPHAHRPAPACHTCPHRTRRSIAGFMVMGCGKLSLRFGTEPDLRRGHVNKAGGCVGMPERCETGNVKREM